MTSLEELWPRFQSEYLAVNQITEARQYTYGVTLKALERVMQRPIVEVTDADVNAYMGERIKAGISPSRIRTELGMLKPFCRWLNARDLIDDERFERIRRLPPPRGAKTGAVPNPYTPAEIRQMFADLDRKYPLSSPGSLRSWRLGRTQHFWRVRRHFQHAQLDAILSLALELGLRRIEILRLSSRDIHLDNAYIVIHGKRDSVDDKIRTVPFTESARSKMREWYSCRRTLDVTFDSPWVNLRAFHPLTAPELGSIMRGLGDGWRLHRLRHTCATERLRAGMPIESLQRLLGHATIEQTLEYAKIVDRDITDAVAKSEAAFLARIGRAA